MSSDAHHLKPPKPGHRFQLPALHGAADSLALARAAHSLQSEQRTLVVVVADAPDAQRLLSEIDWFGKQAGRQLRCHLLPDWETLPYDAFSLLTRIWYQSDWPPCMNCAAANAMC